MARPNVDKLTKIVAPWKKGANKGTRSAWRDITEEAALPDWLFDFFHTYGSGVFAAFDKAGHFLDFLRVLNVFEKPALGHHRKQGEFFDFSNEISRLPYEFFPIEKDGLFPILSTNQGFFLLIDPKDPGRTFTIDNHVVYFREIKCNYVDFLVKLFKGKEQLWFIAEEATVARVVFFGNERAARKAGQPWDI